MLNFTHNRPQKITIAALAVVFLSACGGGSSSAPEAASGGGGAADDGENSSADDSSSGDGTFDLSKYLFPSSVLSSGGQVSFVEKTYQVTESGVDLALTLNRSFSNNNGTIEEYSSDELIKTFTVGDTLISETLITASDFRTGKRFAQVGETFMDANSTPAPDSAFPVVQNASCVLDAHLDSFDLSTATGDYTLSSGVYEDVLRVQCVTSFVANGVKSPHTTLFNYLAKDVGTIFSEGNVFLLEDVYIVEEY